MRRMLNLNYWNYNLNNKKIQTLKINNTKLKINVILIYLLEDVTDWK